MCKKTIFSVLFLFLQIVGVNLYAAESGPTQNQEVGDVVFRRLPPVPITGWFENVHSAIYKGRMRDNKEFFDANVNHDIIEMTGITGKYPCHFKLVDYYKIYWTVCVSSWKGISMFDLKKFKTIEPPYYGSFFSKNSEYDNKEKRARVIEMAERLMNRDIKIEYIVINDDDAEDLVTNYFSYASIEGSCD